MKVLFCSSKLPGSLLIRAVTWSRWSHVVIVDGDYAIEAVWPKVRLVKLEEILASHKDWQFAELTCDHPEKVIEAARSQVGKPYDLTALFGLLVHRDWQDGGRWFCSELVAWAFEKAGTPLFRAEAVHRITPQDLWKISK